MSEDNSVLDNSTSEKGKFNNGLWAVIINLFTVFILYFVLINLVKFAFLSVLDFVYPYFTSRQGLFPTQAGSYLFINYLPKLFHSNPNDFKSIGFGGVVIFPLIYFLICWIFSKSFFFNLKEKVSLIKIKEFSIIFTISFLFIGIPFYHVSNYHNATRILDSAISSEYFLPCIFFFSFFIMLYYIVFNNEKLNYFQLILCGINSFIIASYNEYFQTNILFSLAALFLLLLIFDRKLLRNKNLLYLIIPFIIGTVCFYLFFDKYSMMEKINHNLKDIIPFIKVLINNLFMKKIAFIITMIVLAVLLLIGKNKYNKYILLYSMSILTGLFLANVSTIMYTSIYEGSSFLFEKAEIEVLNVNVFEFIILMLAGTLYYNYKDKCKYLYLFLIAGMITLLFFYVNFYNVSAKKMFELRNLSYNIDLRCAVFNSLGEITLLPESYKNNGELSNGSIFPFNPNIRPYTFENNRVYDYFFYAPYMNYFKSTYGMDLVGIMWVSDEKAQKELVKRLVLLNYKASTKHKKINFKSLYKKFHNIKLSDKDIHTSINMDLSDVELKARAFINYKNKNFDEAKKLYTEYLEKYNPDDLDSLMKLADIFHNEKKIKDEENIYLRLLKIDNANLKFYYNLISIYFDNYNDYEKSLDLVNKMLDVDNKMYAMHLNKANILVHLGRNEEAKETIEAAKKISPRIDIELNKIFNNKKIEDIEEIMDMELKYPEF